MKLKSIAIFLVKVNVNVNVECDQYFVSLSVNFTCCTICIEHSNLRLYMIISIKHKMRWDSRQNVLAGKSVARKAQNNKTNIKNVNK